MAGESQEVMTFESEDARLAALDAFDEKTGNVDDLQRIRDAEIKVAEEGDKPPEPKPEPEPKEDIIPPPEPKPLPQEFVIKREELPERFRDKSPQEVFKSHLSQDELIDKQGKKIQELQSQVSQGIKQSEVAESELKGVQKEAGIKQEKAEDASEIPSSKLSEIMALRQELLKVEEGDEFEPDVLKKKDRLMGLLVEENQRSNMITNLANERSLAIEKKLDEYRNRQDETSITERNKVELKKQLDEMDEFSQIDEFKEEYGMSISAAEADQKYVDWQNQVAMQYYGFLPNRNIESGREQLNYAMYMLNQRSPDIIEKLRVANIPIEPDQDLERYLKLCKLLDERDCIRYDPVQRKQVQLTRYNPQSGKHEPVSFPSLKATIENKRVESGYYKQRELDANKKGAKSFADALTKRDTKELENDTGNAAESQLSIEQANKTLVDFDMEVARKKYYQTGDASVFNDFNAARLKAGQPPLDLTNVPTIATPKKA